MFSRLKSGKYRFQFEPLLHKGNEQYVHHLTLYQCSGNMSAYLFKGERCFSGEGANAVNFSEVYNCASKPLWFWVIGMEVRLDYLLASPKNVILKILFSRPFFQKVSVFHYSKAKRIGS